MITKRPKIQDMSCASIEMQPVSIQWPDMPYDYDNEGKEGTWSFLEALRCEHCGEIVVLSSEGDGAHNDLDPDSDCTGYCGTAEGPMMSYYYPLGGLTEDDARKLVDTCLCVVTVSGETGLALTGGGMDLSWEICEAFMLLGRLPPVHFCDLPGMAGRGINARDRWIVSGCLKSCEVAAQWAERKAARVRDMVRAARKSAAERTVRA